MSLRVFGPEHADPASTFPFPFQGVPGRRRVQRPRRFISSTFAARVSPPAERTLLSSPSVRLRHSAGSLRFSSLSPLHFAADYFGRVERIHYASVQFADFRDRRVGKGRIVRERERGENGEPTEGRKFEGGNSRKRKTVTARRWEKGRWIGVTGGRKGTKGCNVPVSGRVGTTKGARCESRKEHER